MLVTIIVVASVILAVVFGYLTLSEDKASNIASSVAFFFIGAAITLAVAKPQWYEGIQAIPSLQVDAADIHWVGDKITFPKPLEKGAIWYVTVVGPMDPGTEAIGNEFSPPPGFTRAYAYLAYPSSRTSTSMVEIVKR